MWGRLDDVRRGARGIYALAIISAIRQKMLEGNFSVQSFGGSVLGRWLESSEQMFMSLVTRVVVWGMCDGLKGQKFVVNVML